MTTPDHYESKPRRRWPSYLAVGLVLVLMAYPLSIGPTYAVAFRLDNEAVFSVLNFLYAPIGPALSTVGALPVGEAYIDLWCRI